MNRFETLIFNLIPIIYLGWLITWITVIYNYIKYL